MNEKNVSPLVIAFVQGAKWWEYNRTKFTMWQSDQDEATHEGIRRLLNGTLGHSPQDTRRIDNGM